MREGLRHVVVGTQLEAADLVHLLVAGEQNHDRHVGEVADALAELEAVDVRQADVEQYEVGSVALDELHAHLPGGGRNDLRLGPAQPEGQADDLRDVSFVIDDQYTHNPSIPSR